MERLGPNLLRPILDSLDAKLQAKGESRELTVCGGGALLILNIIDRQTRDIDVIAPELDLVLKAVAAEVGREFSLELGWLNNGPASLSRDLESGWENWADRHVDIIRRGFRARRSRVEYSSRHTPNRDLMRTGDAGVFTPAMPARIMIRGEIIRYR